MTEADRLATRFHLARGEEEFRALHDAVAPRLWLFALRLARWSEAEAEELCQETWLRAVRGLDTRRGTSRFTTWLLGICARVDQERARRRRETLVGDPEELARPVHLDTTAFDLELERAVASLPDGARRVLLLHDLEGLTHAEVGARLSISPGTSKSQLHEARRRLRERLASDGVPDAC